MQNTPTSSKGSPAPEVGTVKAVQISDPSLASTVRAVLDRIGPCLGVFRDEQGAALLQTSWFATEVVNQEVCDDAYGQVAALLDNVTPGWRHATLVAVVDPNHDHVLVEVAP